MPLHLHESEWILLSHQPKICCILGFTWKPTPAVAKGKGMDQATWASAKRTSSTFDMGLKNLIQPSNPSDFEIWTYINSTNSCEFWKFSSFGSTNLYATCDCSPQPPQVRNEWKATKGTSEDVLTESIESSLAPHSLSQYWIYTGISWEFLPLIIASFASQVTENLPLLTCRQPIYPSLDAPVTSIGELSNPPGNTSGSTKTLGMFV